MMDCDRCRNSPVRGMVLAEISADPDGRPQITYVPCPGGCHVGFLHCCEGDRASPVPQNEDPSLRCCRDDQ